MVPAEWWITHCCELFVGVAAQLERFYKPELDAAADRRLQDIIPQPAGGVLIPYSV
jgi:hypothetical protein